MKLRSSMQRFGAAPDELDGLEKAVGDAGLDRAGYSIHLPLAGTDAARLAELGRWLGRLESSGRRPRELWVSHLDAATHTALHERWPAWVFPMRTGTALWHGDKSTLHLDRRRPRRPPRPRRLEHAGYRQGVDGARRHAWVDARRRGDRPRRRSRSTTAAARSTSRGAAYALLEPPHMHTSMVFVPDAMTRAPAVGDLSTSSDRSSRPRSTRWPAVDDGPTVDTLDRTHDGGHDLGSSGPTWCVPSP